ncbi:MAG: hypothetical protein ABWY25_12400 [Paenisporosarcina sp.]
MSDQAFGTDANDNPVPPDPEVVEPVEDEPVPEGEESDDPTQPPDGC